MSRRNQDMKTTAEVVRGPEDRENTGRRRNKRRRKRRRRKKMRRQGKI